MATSNSPAQINRDEKLPAKSNPSDDPVTLVKPNSDPPSSGNNKRKRESTATEINTNEERQSSIETTGEKIGETGDVKEMERKTEINTNEETKSSIETTGEKIGEIGQVREVEMKDAEAIEASIEQSVDEIDMKDAENSVKSCESGINLNGGEESRGKQSNDGGNRTGEEVLGEVVKALKEVEENDIKGKLEVEVKVKKLEGSEGNGEVDRDPNRGSGSGSGSG